MRITLLISTCQIQEQVTRMKSFLSRMMKTMVTKYCVLQVNNFFFFQIYFFIFLIFILCFFIHTVSYLV